MYWTTKEGKKLLIVEMETSHIENCIKMMDREETYLVGAEGFCETEYYRDTPVYKKMVEELGRRRYLKKELSAQKSPRLRDEMYDSLRERSLNKNDQTENQKLKEALIKINKVELNQQRPGGGYSESARISYEVLKELGVEI